MVKFRIAKSLEEDLEKIRTIALETRNEVQKELHELEPSDWMGDPEDCGVGAIANYRLWLRLRPFGAKFMVSDEHCFLMLDDLVIDISATQYIPFAKFPVLIMPLEDILKHDLLGPAGMPYKDAKEIPSEEEAKKHFKEWPECQVPFELVSRFHDARLDLFDTAFRYIHALREQILRQVNRYGLRSIGSDYNNRIDIQPIPDWRQRLTPHSVDADRKVYLTCAFTFMDVPEGEAIIDIAIRVRSATLAVVGYYKRGNERIDLISDTSFISDGTESNIASKILDNLRVAWNRRQNATKSH